MFEFVVRNKAIILAVVIIFVVTVFMISSKLYPIAFVGWKPIIYADLSQNYGAALVYYQNAIATYDKDNADIVNSLEVRNEIRRAALESSVEDILISNELEKIFSGPELKNQVLKEVSEVLNGKDIEEEIEILYGLSKGDFARRFLEPQARREILEARFRLENRDFDWWVTDTKKQTKVVIFLPGFEWKEGTVKINKN